jgi:hypothetical protein
LQYRESAFQLHLLAAIIINLMAQLMRERGHDYPIKQVAAVRWCNFKNPPLQLNRPSHGFINILLFTKKRKKTGLGGGREKMERKKK